MFLLTLKHFMMILGGCLLMLLAGGIAFVMLTYCPYILMGLLVLAIIAVLWQMAKINASIEMEERQTKGK